MFKARLHSGEQTAEVIHGPVRRCMAWDKCESDSKAHANTEFNGAIGWSDAPPG